MARLYSPATTTEAGLFKINEDLDAMTATPTPYGVGATLSRKAKMRFYGADSSFLFADACIESGLILPTKYARSGTITNTSQQLVLTAGSSDGTSIVMSERPSGCHFAVVADVQTHASGSLFGVGVWLGSTGGLSSFFANKWMNMQLDKRGTNHIGFSASDGSSTYAIGDGVDMTITAPYSAALVHQDDTVAACYAPWSNGVRGPWQYLASSDNYGTGALNLLLNLRDPAVRAAANFGCQTYSDSGGSAVKLSRLYSSARNSPGQIGPITVINTDGSPYEEGDYVCLTMVGGGYSGVSAGALEHFQTELFRYYPARKTMVRVGEQEHRMADGTMTSLSNVAMVYDPDLGGFHLWGVGWGFARRDSGVDVYYGFSKENITVGHHVIDVAPVSWHASIASHSVYDCAPLKIDGRWFFGAIRSRNGRALDGNYGPFLASGDDPDNFDTVEFDIADTVGREGAKLYTMGGQVWFHASALSGHQCYSITDGSPVGTSWTTTVDTVVSSPAHCHYYPWRVGGQTVYQAFSFDFEKINSGDWTEGNTYVFEASTPVDGTDFTGRQIWRRN